jgi:hypothetical protein
MRSVPEDSFRGGVPSTQLPLLRSLVGSAIIGMTRYSSISPEQDLLKYAPWPKEMEFSLAGGPVLIELDDGRVVGANSDMSSISVMLWLEKAADGRMRENHLLRFRDRYPISALNEEYCSQKIRLLLGQKIVAVRILQRVPHVEQAKRRPREVGVVLELEDGNKLLLGHGLCDGGSFCVITIEQVTAEILSQLVELLRFPENQRGRKNQRKNQRGRDS